MSFIAKVRAKTGFLIGGVTEHRSSRFESRRDAFDWAWLVRDTNRAAGRDVDPEITIISSQLLAEISKTS